jgi:hypothetical protein
MPKTTTKTTAPSSALPPTNCRVHALARDLEAAVARMNHADEQETKARNAQRFTLSYGWRRAEKTASAEQYALRDTIMAVRAQSHLGAAVQVLIACADMCSIAEDLDSGVPTNDERARELGRWLGRLVRGLESAIDYMRPTMAPEVPVLLNFMARAELSPFAEPRELQG